MMTLAVTLSTSVTFDVADVYIVAVGEKHVTAVEAVLAEQQRGGERCIPVSEPAGSSVSRVPPCLVYSPYTRKTVITAEAQNGYRWLVHGLSSPRTMNDSRGNASRLAMASMIFTWHV